jgi:hypothetical protein
MALAQQQGVQVDMPEVYKDIINTFEKKDVNRFIKPVDVTQMMGGLQQQGGGGNIQSPQAQQTPASLTESVAKGNITSGIV